ncbi:hypothetical protein ACFV6Z_29830 [Streptomyces sp. NPDC059818]|uniref:hypothetical protein n=1 Tax=Streptomyces sp. NPDC059818 TaxID=3346962 RepID=UPI00364CE4B9
MPGELKILKHDFKVGGVWEGQRTAATLMHFHGPAGAGGTTGFESAHMAMGSTSAKLVGEADDDVEAVRLAIEVATGRWHLTHDRFTGDTEFVNEATGEATTHPVKPDSGQQSAGAFTLGLMGLPVVETDRGAVTLDAVLQCLCLSQRCASTAQVGGAIGGQNHESTWEIAAGLLDEKALRLRAKSRHTASKARKERKQLEELQDKRRANGLVTAADLDRREARHRADETGALADLESATTALDDAERLHTKHKNAATTGQEALAAAEHGARQAAHALRLRCEERGAARERHQQAQDKLADRTYCPDCTQQLVPPAGDQTRCPLCKEHDAEQPTRGAQRQQEVRDAERAEQRAEQAVRDAEGGETVALARRDDAAAEARRLQRAADTFQLNHVATAQAARDQARARQREARIQLDAVNELRKELHEVKDREARVARWDAAAQDAERAWKNAETAADERRSWLAKELTGIFAPLLTEMTTEVRDAYIESKAFTPMVNGRPPKNLRHHAGLFNLIQLAWHLTLFTAARTVDGFNLPAFLWLDSPLDGLGGGERGERHAAAALRAIVKVSAAAGDEGQIILTTPQALPTSHNGVRTTLLDDTDRYIPHLQAR